MRIHVCRHGEAEPQSVSGRDLDRPLTRQGHLQARYLARVLSQAFPSERPRRLITSPAMRTTQTAQAVADELGLAITTLDALLPTCETAHALRIVEEFNDHPSLVMVGHNPTMTALVSVLMHGLSASVSMPGPALRTGQMASVEIDRSCTPGRGRLIQVDRFEPAMA